MYPHETHILDKFKDEYLKCKINLWRKGFYILSPHCLQNLFSLTNLLCVELIEEVLRIENWHQLYCSHKNLGNEFNVIFFLEWTVARKFYKPTLKNFCLLTWYECINDCMSKMFNICNYFIWFTQIIIVKNIVFQ